MRNNLVAIVVQNNFKYTHILNMQKKKKGSARKFLISFLKSNEIQQKTKLGINMLFLSLLNPSQISQHKINLLIRKEILEAYTRS